MKLGLDYIKVQWFMSVIGLGVLVFLLIMIIKDVSKVKLAIRNVFRNKRRSIITVIAIIGAVSGTIVVGTYFLNMFVGLRETSIYSRTGHLQYMKKGYYEKGSAIPTEYLIDNSKEIIESLRSNEELMQHVSLMTVQSQFSGLISNGDKTLNFIATAVESEKDKLFAVSDLYEEGRSLSEKKPYEIVIGSGLAKQLSISTGNVTTILTTMRDGGINVLDATIRGIVRPFSKDYGDVIIKTDIQFAQELLFTQGVNKIIILLNATENTEKAEAIMRTVLSQHPEWGLELFNWYDLQDFYKQVVDLFSGIFVVISTMFFILILFLILNTMSMSVFERFGEFGTLRAIGMKRRSLVGMVLIEGTILGLLGVILGIIISFLIGYIVALLKVEMSPPPGGSTGYPLNLIPYINFEGMKLFVVSSLSAIGISFVSTLFPSLWAARQKIIDCLRFV